MSIPKKLVCLTLTISLLASLALPALAWEPEEKDYGDFMESFYAQYTQEHPQEYADFDPHAWWVQDWGEYWDSEEEYIAHMVDMGYWESPEDFAREMWQGYLGPKADRAWNEKIVEDYRAAHPGELEALTTEELLARKGYTQTLTPAQQLMEDWPWVESEEAVRPVLLADYVSARNTAERNHALCLEYREANPDRWAEFDAEAYFHESYGGMDKEEYQALWSLASEDEFIEQMFVEYVNSESWEWEEDRPWQPVVIPDDEPCLVVNGVRRPELDLTTADGVSYLPAEELNELLGTHYVSSESPVALRSAAESAGWDVTWNSLQNEVVLLDRETILKGLDLSRFEELMGRLFSAVRTEEGQSYQTVGTWDLTLTEFDSLDGDRSYSAQIGAQLTTRDRAVDLTLTADASQLLELLPEKTAAVLARELPKRLRLPELKTLLSGCKLQLLLDLERGELYWNLPLLALVETELTEDTWFHLSLEGWDVSNAGEMLAALQRGELRLGERLYDTLLADSAQDWWGADNSYEEFARLQVLLNGLLGPDTIAEKNGTLTWQVNTERVNRLMSQAVNADLVEPLPTSEGRFFQRYELSVSVTPEGTVTSSVDIRPDMEGMVTMLAGGGWTDSLEAALLIRLLELFDFQETARSSGTADHSTGTAQFHWKNQFKLELSAATDRQKTPQAPRTTPPEGAEILELG